jgi:tight adherence protein B
MKRPAVFLAIVGALACSAPSWSATLSPGTAPFPGRNFVLTLPKGVDPSPGAVRVTENGQPVEDLSVTPATSVGRQDLGEVLVIDASQSMHNGAIDAAMAAARAFAQQRNANQPLGVIFFNDTQRVALQPTTDASAIAAALVDSPQLNHGTRIYDAIGAAAGMLRDAHISTGSIVLLSDGADTGSIASARKAVGAVSSVKARLFTIGLRSAAFDASTLTGLARAAHGRYVEATATSALAPIFTSIGAELAHSLVIRYQSVVKRGAHVTVAVQAGPVRATSLYTAPVFAGLRLHVQPHQRSFLSSTAGLVLESLLAAVLLFVAVRAIQAHRSAPAGVRTRVAPYSLGESPGPDAAAAPPRRALPAVVPARWRDDFALKVELADLDRDPSEVALWVVIASAVTAFLLTVGTGSIAGVLCAAFVPIGFTVWLNAKVRRRRALFAEQLPDNLQIVASTMRTGQSFVGALAMLSEQAPEPSRTEFRRVAADEQLGMPLDEALDALTQRMRNRDLDQLAVVATIQRETGGNAAEAIDRIVETVRSKDAVRRMVSALTAQGRMVRWVLTILPVALLFILTAVNPDYMRPLFTEGWGRALLALGACLVTAGSLWIKRIVEIEI